MTKLILIISSFLFAGAVNVESVYTNSVTSIEGVSKPLSAYEGKKILVITLPTVQNSGNDSLLHAVDSLGTTYASSLVIIAVPSYEDGYTAENKNTLKTWYRSILGSNVIVTEGIYTRKTSGSQQHSLFKWLTDKDRNGRFNQDVDGPRDKFVVWTNGKLVGVLAPQTKLNSHTMNNLLLEQ